MSDANQRKAVVTIIFYTLDKRVLLQGREGISRYGEEWSFFGGGIEEGETPEEAVIREVKEELDYDLKGHWYVTHRDRENPLGGVTRVHYFLAKIHGLDKFTLLEGSEMRLFTVKEAAKLKMISGEEEGLEFLERVF